MKNCLKCRTQVEDGIKFCPNCGSNEFENLVQTIPQAIPTIQPNQVKKGLKWWQILLIVIGALLVLFFAIGIFAPDDTDNNSVGGNIDESDSVDNTVVQSQYVLTDDIYDFQVQVDGVVYQFPMTVSEFLSLGWEFGEDEDPDAMLEAQYTNYSWFEHKDGYRTHTTIANFSKSAQKSKDCYIVGLDIKDVYDWEIDACEVVFAKGIKRGVSTKQDITNAYGSPVDIYESDNDIILTYQVDGYREIEFEIEKSTDLLTNIDIENIVMPEDFVEGEVSNEIPEYIKNYTAPTELGTDLKSGKIQLDGVVYQFPIPVSVLMENGWELQTQSSDETIAGKDNGDVKLSKNGVSIESYDAANYESYAIPIKYGAIQDLTLYNNEAKLNLPNGIYVEMTEAELLSKLEGQEYSLEDDESWRQYVIELSQWEHDGTTKNNITISVDAKDKTVSYITIDIEIGD